MKTVRSVILLIGTPTNPNKYLVYLDKGWGTWLFPNIPNKNQPLMDIKREISQQCGVPLENLIVKEKAGYSEEKPCKEHNDELRKYEYRIIEARTKEKVPVWAENTRTFETLMDLLKIDHVETANGNLIRHIMERA